MNRLLKRAPSKIEFTYTVVNWVARDGVWVASVKAEYWHHNEGIYQGKFDISPNGTNFQSLEDALNAAIKYEDTMDALASQYAR